MTNANAYSAYYSGASRKIGFGNSVEDLDTSVKKELNSVGLNLDQDACEEGVITDAATAGPDQKGRSTLSDSTTTASALRCHALGRLNKETDGKSKYAN